MVKETIDIAVVADVKGTASGIDLLNDRTGELVKKFQELQAILTKIENAKPGKQFQGLFGAAGQNFQQATQLSGRSNLDNDFINRLVRAEMSDIRAGTGVIKATMKKFDDGISKLLKDMTDDARDASRAIQDARRARTIQRVRGRSAAEIMFDEDYDAAQRENERRDRRAQQVKDKADREKEKREAKERAETRRISPLSTEEVNTAVMRRFQLSQAAREYQGGSALLKERFNTFTEYASIGLAVGSVTAMIKGIIDLDKELRQFQAITGTSNQEMKGFEKTLLDLTVATKFSAVELATVATALGQAGLSAKQVGPALDAVQKLAAASGSSLKEAGDLVTSTIGVFNVQGSEVASVANTFTSALNLSKLTMEQLTLGFQYGANVARDLGLSYTELTAALGTLANSGIRSGSTLGTGLRQLLIDLQTPTEKAKQTFARLGITLDDINVRSHGLTGVLENLRAKGFTTSDAFNALEVRAVTAFSALTAGIDQTRRLEQQMLLSNAAAEALNVQMQGFAAQATRLYNSISVLIYRAFKPLMDTFGQIIGVVANVVGAFAKLETVLGVGGTFFGVAAMTFLLARLAAFGQSLFAISAGFTSVAASSAAAAAGTTAFAASAGTAGILGRVAMGAGAVSGALAGPLGLAATAAVAGGVYLYSQSGRSNPLDRAQGSLSDAQGNYDATTSTLTRLREEMQKLIDRQAELDKSDEARKTRILELRKAFGELGLSISDSAKSTDEMVAALRRLEGQLNERSLNQNLLRIAARETKIREMEVDYEKTLRDNRRSLGRSPEAISRRLGEAALVPYEAATGIRRPEAGQSGNDFYTRELANVIRLIEASQGNANVGYLEKLRDAIRELLTKSSSVESERIALRNNRQDQVRDQYNVLSDRTGLTERVTEAERVIGARRTEIEANKNLVERLRLTKELQDYTTEYFLPLLQARQILIDEMKRNATPELMRIIDEMARVNPVEEARNRTRSRTAQIETNDKKTEREIQLALINGQVERINAEIGNAQARSRTTNSQRTILEIGNKIQELIRQRTLLELEKLEKERGSDNQTPPEVMETLRAEIRRKSEEELGRAATQNSETLREAQRNILRQTDALADRQLAILANQQKMIQDRMKDPNITANQMARLQDEFNKIVEQREAIIRGQNERARAMNPERGGFVPSATATATQALIGSALGEYGLRIASLETGGTFNPNARNARSGAYGLFQFLPSTLAGDPNGGLGGLANENASFRKLLQDAGITNSAQLNEALKEGRITIPVQMQIELMNQFTQGNRRILGGSANDESLALSHFLGAGGAKKLLDAIISDPNMQALGNGITRQGLSQNNLSQTSTVSQVRDFYLNLYRNRNVSNLGSTETQLRDQQAQTKIDEEKLDQIRKSIQNSEVALQNARKEADQRLAQARTAVRAAQEGMALGNASEGDVQKAQRELRLAQLNQYQVELNANLREQANVQKQINDLNGTDEGSRQRRNELQNYLNTLTNKEKELRNEVNIANRSQVQTPINFGGLTQTYLQRQGYLTAEGKVNTKGMIESGFMELVGGVDKAFQNLFMTLATGSKTAGEAFKAFGLSIVQTMMSIISRRLSEALIDSLFGNLLKGGAGGGAGGGFGGFLSGLGSFFGGGGAAAGAAPVISPFTFFANGGLVRASNGYAVGRDSVPALLMPGEVVMRKSAVDAIGEDNLLALNNQGNRRNSDAFSSVAQNDNAAGSGVVNVWVVSQDQVPPPSQSDIIAIVSSDISRGGTVKQLIKQVQMGVV